ncbi:MAG: arsenite S-adenosylmethyltransferase, partial [Gemmatimonadetes bacterium]|nr:arsenite S-adenosylmethyltransferase [Gemmatimonadota bacterium]
ALLSEAGFIDVSLEPTRIYRPEEARDILEAHGLDPEAVAADVEGRLMAAFVRATKPEPAAEAACRGSDCCA